MGDFKFTIFFCKFGNGTQDLMHARQVLYYGGTPSALNYGVLRK
jgi:hypothetical protein